jgi:hypothetical protein
MSAPGAEATSADANVAAQLRTAADVIDLGFPSLAKMARELAPMFEIGRAFEAAKSGELADALKLVGDLPSPGDAVAGHLRRVARAIESGALKLNVVH